MENQNPNLDRSKLIEEANKKYAEFMKKKLKDETVDMPKSSIIDKVKSFATSMVSRGLDDKKCSEETKLLRVLSCHGDEKQLAACSERKKSTKYPESFYCGACGCGDKKTTQLVNVTIKVESQYSKLDYPKVSCPLKMPGFTDYTPSQSGVSDNYRKKEIESRYGVEYIKQQSTA